MTALSILDLVPVRRGQTSAQAVGASLNLVQHAEAAGFARYWFAEHHNMPAVASTTPPVLIAAAAGRTTRIRLGSGGVMLPNHAPLIVAEQFAALDAIAPGRIDLGIGRAPGSDPVITHLLRQSGTASDVERFPDHVRDILALTSPDGATMRFVNGGEYIVHATPQAAARADVWLLGSSDYSAQLAAELGLPYVFANHFSGQGLERALDLYRTQFRASEYGDTPRTFLTANAIVAPTQDEAEKRALPQLRMFAKLRTNQKLGALETVEDAQAALPTQDEVTREFITSARTRWFVGEPADVRSQLDAFAERHGVDEIMISPVAGAFADEPLDAAPGRVQTVTLLAADLSAEDHRP